MYKCDFYLFAQRHIAAYCGIMTRLAQYALLYEAFDEGRQRALATDAAAGPAQRLYGLSLQAWLDYLRQYHGIREGEQCTEHFFRQMDFGTWAQAVQFLVWKPMLAVKYPRQEMANIAAAYALQTDSAVLATTTVQQLVALEAPNRNPAWTDMQPNGTMDKHWYLRMKEIYRVTTKHDLFVQQLANQWTAECTNEAQTLLVERIRKLNTVN